LIATAIFFQILRKNILPESIISLGYVEDMNVKFKSLFFYRCQRKRPEKFGQSQKSNYKI